MGPNEDPRGGGDMEIPFMQRMFDKPFLLLFLGVSVVGLFYTVWGLIEILTIPPATLP